MLCCASQHVLPGVLGEITKMLVDEWSNSTMTVLFTKS